MPPEPKYVGAFWNAGTTKWEIIFDQDIVYPGSATDWFIDGGPCSAVGLNLGRVTLGRLGLDGTESIVAYAPLNSRAYAAGFNYIGNFSGSLA